MNRFTVIALSLAMALSGAVAACSDRHDDFGIFTNLPAEGLAYGDTLTITVSGLDSAVVARRLRLGVRHSSDYEYRNAILEITYPDGNHLRRDTIDIELADVYGSWLGNGIGPSHQQAVTVNDGARITDSARITVRHVMRVDTLRGIEQIGIIVDKP